MATIFRPDIINEEGNFFISQTFKLPRISNVYSISRLMNHNTLNQLAIIDSNFNLVIPQIHKNEFTEHFLKGCFKKCKQFVLEDWIDFDEVDCTVKCANKTKESFEILLKTFNQ